MASTSLHVLSQLFSKALASFVAWTVASWLKTTCAASRVTACVKVLFFRLESLPLSSFCRQDSGLFEVNPDLHCFSCKSRIAACTRAPACSAESCRKIDRVKVRTADGHYSGDTKPTVSWRIPRLNVRAQPTLYRAAVLLQFLRKRCKRIEHFTHNQ